MTRNAISNAAWARAVELYPVGSVVTGFVGEVWPFGVIVDLPQVGLAGFLAYPNLDPAGTPITPGSDAVPDVGDMIEAVVVHQQDRRHQLWLSCRLEHYPECVD